MRQILVVDDDPLTHALVKGALGSDFKLISVFDLASADQYLSSGKPVQLIIIDRMMPDGDGLSLCAKIRADQRHSALPVLFLSSKISESDKVTGLYAGADDYLEKPFSPLELKARVQARFRSEKQKLYFGGISIDLSAHRVFENETEIDLTRKEFKLLLTFIQSPDRLFSRNELLTKVWGDETYVTDRVVDTTISHLRKKFSNCGFAIEALRGEGYKIVLVAKSPHHAA